MISWLTLIQKTLVSILQSRNVASRKGLLSTVLLGYAVAMHSVLTLRAFSILDCPLPREIIFRATSGIASFSFTLTFSLSFAVTSRQVLLS